MRRVSHEIQWVCSCGSYANSSSHEIWAFLMSGVSSDVYLMRCNETIVHLMRFVYFSRAVAHETNFSLDVMGVFMLLAMSRASSHEQIDLGACMKICSS